MRKYLFALLFISGFAHGQKAGGFDDVLKHYQLEQNFTGTLLVANHGKINFQAATGKPRRDSGTNILLKSKFKIASITKTFTAVLIMQLVEKEQLDLKATIGTYLADYNGEAKNKVTIENLLTYSSGLPNCESYIGEEIYRQPITRDSFIIKYCSGNLSSNPGTKFNYNNGDYVILGKIVEAVSGKSFEECLEAKILKPLKMPNTGMLKSTALVTGLVPSYTYDDSLKIFTPDPPYYIENYFSAGAMYSTAEDLLKFDQGIFSCKILQKKTVALMLTPYPSLGNVGLGFWISENYGALNSRFAYRPGGIYGATANWIHVIDSNRAIIALSNSNASNLFEISQQLNAVATGKPAALSKKSN
ncbi:MAG: beta-lactamase family protein [Rhizobacter sp.]|nr:beta-lactamase family protein [Ferruginibacter sp.]